MLHKFIFKNFFSFADETEVSFRFNRQVAASELTFMSPSGVCLSKILAAIGPNASGKTNVLKPLTFLSWFVSHSFTSTKPENDNPVQAHFFSDSKDSEFEIEFEHNDQHYRYRLCINPKRVVHESLYCRTSQHFSIVFRRNYLEQGSTYVIRQQNFGLTPREAEKVRPNASLIATAAQYNVLLAKELVSYFYRFHSNVNYIGRDHFEGNNVLDAANFFFDRPALYARISEILTRLDFGLAEVVIESHDFMDKDSGKNEDVRVPYGIHRKGKRKHKIPFWLESSGTQAVFVLLEKILPALEQGGVVIIDEMEAGLHPEMIMAILDLFIDSDCNPHNTQIIFTCHAHEILDDLQKEQILLVEKDSDGFSKAWRLSDMRGIRRDDNLYTKYRAGAYGAVPNL